MGAGTDANVYITLNGTTSKINRYLLKKSETARDPFELKSKDIFKFNEIDIGKVSYYQSQDVFMIIFFC